MTDRPDPRSAQRALLESEDRYARLIQEAPDPIVTVDLLGRVQTVNPAAEHAVGYPASKLLGQHFSTLGIVSPASLPRAIEEFAFAVAGTRRDPFELEVIHLSGQRLVFEANPRPFERNGGIAGVHVVFRDVTRRKRAEETLRSEQVRLHDLAARFGEQSQRIQSLEQEVNDLLGRLGKPKKYEAGPTGRA
jgi:PAS domain S-box-containing protein